MRIVSGIKPSGQLTLGNYIGAIKQFLNLQEKFSNSSFFIFIADLHAITIPINSHELEKNIREIAATYIACGLDPLKVNIFLQSEVKEHTQLSYIMESTSHIGELERMIQYKDKKNYSETIRTSLFTYPNLMAADILLYDADIVPVGSDQSQHLELTRTLAKRFNHNYGKTFKIPEGYKSKIGSKIMSLTDPIKKMAKTEKSSKSYILLSDDLTSVKKKIYSAVTDNDNEIYFDEKKKPGLSNLITIYASLSNNSIKETEKKFKNSSYKEFKDSVYKIIAETLEPIQKKYKSLINSKKLDEILDKGKKEASKIAKLKILDVYNKVGLKR